MKTLITVFITLVLCNMTVLAKKSTLRDIMGPIRIGKYILTLSPEWRDLTSYNYKNTIESKALTIGYGIIPNSETISLEELIENKKLQLQNLASGNISFKPIKYQSFLGTRLGTLEFTTQDGKNKFHEFLGMTFLDKKTYMTISLVSSDTHSELFKEYSLLLDTVLAGNTPFPSVVEADHRWERPGKILLQIPNTLKSPKIFKFKTRDNNYSLKIIPYNIQNNSPKYSLKEEVTHDQRFGGGIKEFSKIEQGEISGEEVYYNLLGGDPLDPVMLSAYRGRIIYKNWSLGLLIKSKKENKSLIQAHWNKIRSGLKL